jgi:hypothetical protein
VSSLLGHARWVLGNRALEGDERARWQAGAAQEWAASESPGVLLALLALTDVRLGVRAACACARHVLSSAPSPDSRISEALAKVDAWCDEKVTDDETVALLDDVANLEQEIEAEEDEALAKAEAAAGGEVFIGPLDWLGSLSMGTHKLVQLAGDAARVLDVGRRGFRDRYDEDRSHLVSHFEYFKENLVRAVATISMPTRDALPAELVKAEAALARFIRGQFACPTVEQLDAARLPDSPPDPIGGLVGSLRESEPVAEWFKRFAPSGNVEPAWEACRSARWQLFVLVWLGDRREVVRASCACARHVLALAGDHEPEARAALEAAESWAAGNADAEAARAACVALADVTEGLTAGRSAWPMDAGISRPVLLLAVDPDLDIESWACRVVLHAVHAVTDDLEALRPTADMVAWNAAIVSAQAGVRDTPEILEDDYADALFEQAIDNELEQMAVRVRTVVRCPTREALSQLD